MSIGSRRLEPIARGVWPPASLAIAFLITWVVTDSAGSVFWTDTAVKMFLTLIVVLGLQMFSGNSGVLSFGHIGFMAIGAYT